MTSCCCLWAVDLRHSGQQAVRKPLPFCGWSLRIAAVSTQAVGTDGKCGGAYPLMAKARFRGPSLEAARAGLQDQPG